MVNHPNRNTATVETLRGHLVPATKKIKHGEFSKISKPDGERLILVADWESRQIFITIATGPYGSMRVQKGLDESFEVKYLIPTDVESEFDFICGTIQGRHEHGNAPQDEFDTKYQAYILDAAMTANEILDSVPKDDVVGDDVKTQVRALLEPFRNHYDRQQLTGN